MLVSRNRQPSFCKFGKDMSLAVSSERLLSFGKRRIRLDEVLTAPEGSGLPLPSLWKQEAPEPAVSEPEAGKTSIGRAVHYVDSRDDKQSREPPQLITKDAMRRLAMEHVREPHSCAHCDKINIDFFEEKSSRWESPSDSAWVRCAKSTGDVAAAQRDGCHFFRYLFGYPGFMRSGINSLQQEDFFLRVEFSKAFDEHRSLFSHNWAFHNSHILYHAKDKTCDRTRNNRPKDRPQFILCHDHQSRSHVHPEHGLALPFYSPDVDTGESLEWARSSLETCLEFHSECKAPTMKESASFVPTRLIQVDYQPKHIRLVHGFTLDSKTRWCCLSYVWGGNQPVKTTKDTISRHSSAIPLERLPPAIHDAVTVCRALGLSYLWVDALCIVQDDAEDKVREMAVMSEIYRLSHVVICAASSTGVEHGFLHNRGYFFSSRSSPPVRLRLRNQKGETGVLLAFATEGQEDEPDYNSPIEERGWCFQERRLAPRVLYYGPRGLMYICQVKQIRDRGPCTRAWIGESMDRFHTFGETRFMSRDWRDVVSNYSRRLLSQPEDKLLACAAVASAAQRSNIFRKKQKYLAGLWKEELPVGLDWYVPPTSKGTNLRPRRSKFLAPTWSWAAVDSGVRFWSNEPIDAHCRWPPLLSSKVKIVSAVASPEVAELPFGSAKDGMLVIKGETAAINWTAAVGETTGAAYCDGFRFPVYRDALEEVVDPSDDGEGSLLALRLFSGSRYSMVISEYRTSPGQQTDGVNCGLVLQRVDEDHYARVGLFYCCREREGKHLRSCDHKFKSFKKKTVKIV